MSLSPKQEQLFKQASKHIPGGVNSPVRAFNGVGGTPVFIEKAKGAYLWDVDGKRYVDYVGSWGPMILGHAHPDIIKAVQTAAEDGLSFAHQPYTKQRWQILFVKSCHQLNWYV